VPLGAAVSAPPALASTRASSVTLDHVRLDAQHPHRLRHGQRTVRGDEALRPAELPNLRGRYLVNNGSYMRVPRGGAFEPPSSGQLDGIEFNSLFEL
jgi:hypothetical protein